jgi:hypothetical protein
MANFPGPYEIEFLLSGWTSPAREHNVRLSVAVSGTPSPGDLPTTIDIQKTGGATAKLDVVANQIWSFYRQNYHTTISAIGYTLWKYVPGTLAKDYVSAGTVTTPLGTSGVSPTIAGQCTLTFRTANGGVLKCVFIESSSFGDVRQTLLPNVAGNASQKIGAYILSADNVALGRDDSYPVAAMRDSRGQNEKIWRKIYRA